MSIDPNIIDGFVDANQDGVINAFDSVTDVALWCNDAAPIRVDLIGGGVDVNEGGAVVASDELMRGLRP